MVRGPKVGASLPLAYSARSNHPVRKRVSGRASGNRDSSSTAESCGFAVCNRRDSFRRRSACSVGQTVARSTVFRGKQRVGVLREFSSTFDFPVRRTGIVGFYYLYIYFYIYSVSHWHCFSHRFFDGVFEKHVRVSPLCSSPTVHYLLICGRREYMHYASFCKL